MRKKGFEVLGGLSRRSMDPPKSLNVVKQMWTSSEGNSNHNSGSRPEDTQPSGAHKGDRKGIKTNLHYTGIKNQYPQWFQAMQKQHYQPFVNFRKLSKQKPDNMDAYLEALDQHSQNFLPKDNKVCMRMPASTLQKIIETGDYSFKSIHVMNTSNSLPEMQVRRNVEKFRLGNYSQDVPDKDRPIHGYIASGELPLGVRKDQYNALNWYGNVAIVFKGEVKRRTSFTVGDSYGPDEVRAVPLEKPNRNCFPLRSLEESLDGDLIKDISEQDPLNKQFGDWAPYIEAQIHYGVSLEDVEMVVLTKAAADNNELIAELEKARIPYRKERPDEYSDKSVPVMGNQSES